MKDKLQTWCVMIGFGMIGPALLGRAISCLFVGEISGRREPLLRASENPAAFYIVAIALIIISLKMTQISLVGALEIYRRLKRHSENPE